MSYYSSLLIQTAADRLTSVSKDDALARPEIAHRSYPPCVEDLMASIRTFIEASDDVNRTLLDLMSDRLGLPREVLRSKHKLTEHSPSESRIIRNPPREMTKEEVAIGAHTDFGTLVSEIQDEKIFAS